MYVIMVTTGGIPPYIFSRVDEETRPMHKEEAFLLLDSLEEKWPEGHFELFELTPTKGE